MALLFAGVLGFFFVSVEGSGWFKLSDAWAWWFAIVVPVLSFCLYAAAVRTGERRVASEIRLTRPMIADFFIGTAFGFFYLCVMVALLRSLGLYQVHWSHWSGAWSSLVFNSYISATLEELAFRAILLRLFARLIGPIGGLGVSAALFGLAHISHGSWLGVFGVFFNAGFALGLLYMVTGRLWMSVGMHMAWDFTEDSILGVGNSQGLLQSTPILARSAFLTGGSFGPDASLLSCIPGIAAIVAILYCNSRGMFGSSIEKFGAGSN